MMQNTKLWSAVAERSGDTALSDSQDLFFARLSKRCRQSLRSFCHRTPKTFALLAFFSILLPFSPPAFSLDIVRDGKPAAVIVIPKNPVESVRYAADELAWHIEKSTGAKLQTVSENMAHELPAPACIYLGDTITARAAGIEASKLHPESFILLATGRSFIIAGRDAPGDPLGGNTSAGTLFGVYEFLQAHLGVIWAWPGELGAFVPKKRDITVPGISHSIPSASDSLTIRTPHFIQRHVRGGLTFKDDYPGLGFSPEAAADYAREQSVFLRRHRMGREQPMSYGHAFTTWWKQYGAEHPEWFQLVNGKRGPERADGGGSYSMCVSNPQVLEKHLSLWREKRAQQIASGAPLPPVEYLNACENGINGLCECDECRALDGPRPANFDTFYRKNSKVLGKPFVTDRYAKFWLALQREAEKTNPNVHLIVYNYFNYFHHPSPSIKLNPRILVGSYPSGGWHPRSPAENQWYLENWLGWKNTGARLFMRGNYCLDGYNMPHVFARAFIDEFHFQYRNGLVATDYDALTGHWAAQGPNIYALMRLHTTPGATADAILGEYYSAFGPAAQCVKEYFDYWENYAIATRDRTNLIFDDNNASRWRSWATVAHLVYPENTFADAAAILARAAAAAARDTEAAARVRFLQNGLEHARLCAKVSALLTTADPQSTPARGRAALDELIAFRRAHEREWISNLNHSAWVEAASWKLTESKN